MSFRRRRGLQPRLKYGIRALDVPQKELDALGDLYWRTDGDNWTDNTNWLQSRTVGDWYGVTVSGGHVTEVDLNNNNLVGTCGAEILPDSLEELRLYSNGSLDCSFDLSDLPSGMTFLHLANTSSTITGALSDLPSGMARLRLYSTSSTITGALSDLPSGMTHLYLSYTSSTITGGASAISATGIRVLRLENMGLSQAEVDGIVERIYTDWASLTYGTPELNIGADDAEPSGTYQDGDPPSTGKEYIYELANDPEATGNNTWSITYNTGAGDTTVP